MKQIHVMITEYYSVTGTDSTPVTRTARVHKSHMTQHLDSLGASVTLGQVKECSTGATITVNGFYGPVTIRPHI